MIILGIDPGSRYTGYAVVQVSGRAYRYIGSGTIYFGEIKNFIERLGIIYNECLALVSKYNPDEIALESLIYVKSVSALSKLAQARGAMLAAFNQTHTRRVFEYSPNLIKATVTGHGHATKESIQKGLKMILGPIDFKTSDESDALAISLCHALNRGQTRRQQYMGKL